MVDILTPAERSQRMGRIKSKDSVAEVRVRSIVHRMGFRYRLHDKKLPGKPDIVLPRHKKVIFVHGCYWHQHGICRPLTLPQTNSEFWRKKFSENIQRDARNLAALTELGWQVLIVWECETKDIASLKTILQKFLDPQ